MDRINADAAAIADTLERTAKLLRAPSAELRRRVASERVRVRGYFVSQEREAPLSDALRAALQTRLAQLQRLLPEVAQQTDAAQQYLHALKKAPRADKYQTGRLAQLQRDAATPRTLWLGEFVAYLWTHHCH